MPTGYKPFSDTARPKRRAVSPEKNGPFHHLQNTPSSGGSHRDNGRFRPAPDGFPPATPFSGMTAASRRSVRHIPDNPAPAAFMRPSRKRTEMSRHASLRQTVPAPAEQTGTTVSVSHTIRHRTNHPAGPQQPFGYFGRQKNGAPKRSAIDPEKHRSVRYFQQIDFISQRAVGRNIADLVGPVSRRWRAN